MNYKTGVVNDPLGQPTVPAGIEDLFCFGRFLKVGTDGRIYGRTDNRVNIVLLPAGTVVDLVDQ